MNSRLPILALIIASIIWGATAPIIKWALGNIPPFSLAFSRFFIATLIFLPFVIGKLSLKISDLPKIIIAAILGVTLNIALFFGGLKLTSAINAGILITVTPVFTMLAAAYFLKERILPRMIAGVCFSIFGLAIILARSLFEGETQFHLAGDSLIILATLCWVGYEMFSKKLLKIYSARTLTFYAFLIGALTFLPLAAYELGSQPDWFRKIDYRGIIGITYGAIFSSTIAYSLWQWGLSKMDACKVGVFLYLDPLAAALVAVPLLNEKITPLFLFGSVFVLLGIWLTEQKFPYHPLHKLKR